MLAAVDMFLRFPPPRQVPAVTNDRAGTCLSPSYRRMAGKPDEGAACGSRGRAGT